MYTNNVCLDEEIRKAFARIITKYSSFYVDWKAHHVVWSGFLMPADKSEDTVEDIPEQTALGRCTGWADTHIT